MADADGSAEALTEGDLTAVEARRARELEAQADQIYAAAQAAKEAAKREKRERRQREAPPEPEPEQEPAPGPELAAEGQAAGGADVLALDGALDVEQVSSPSPERGAAQPGSGSPLGAPPSPEEPEPEPEPLLAAAAPPAAHATDALERSATHDAVAAAVGRHITTLQAELSGLKVGQLRKRAAEEALPEAAVDAALDVRPCPSTSPTLSSFFVWLFPEADFGFHLSCNILGRATS